MLKSVFVCLVCVFPAVLSAQDRTFALNAPSELVETGVLKHLIPRFSLKKGIRIKLTADAGDAAIGTDGTPVFSRGDTVWHFTKTDGPHTDEFLKWLLSDVGKRTIETFVPSDGVLFSADVKRAAVAVETVVSGDIALGESSSITKCGRCHAVSDSTRMSAIGSTPSFALLRSFDDWEDRFFSFFALRPHPAFTQVAEVTEPFSEHLPSPIAPVEVTLGEIDAIVAFVAQMEPADLGAPLKSQ